MPQQGLPAARLLRLAAVALAMVAAACMPSMAQDDTSYTSFSRSAVGGISVSTDGVLDNATVDATGRLQKFLRESVTPAPGGMHQAAPLRKVSLRRLEAAVAQCVHDGKPLADEMLYLAGLQEIRYVLVYPEQNDIVLAGPGEGWRVDDRGTVVGINTGRPVMLLDDLLVALRTARGAQQQAISCSIDPLPEGVARLRAYVNRLKDIGNPRETISNIEQALGPQKITVTGVPDSSHFARVLVAADYRMKRIAMNFEPSPVAAIPSFLEMVRAKGRGLANVMPRWWLEPRYESVMRSPDHLAWELRGATVRAMTEEDFFADSGQRTQTGRANAIAQRWADLMTEHYDQLALADPVFGQLRNCMEMAVVAAVVVREDLTVKAGYSMPTLLDPTDVEIQKFPAPKQVDTRASAIKKGRNWIISASGGVEINSYAVIQNVVENEDLATTRAQAAANDETAWWWN